MHEMLNHTVTKHLAKKIKKYSHFQIITTNNRKHVSDFISDNTYSFMELLLNNATHFSGHQTILTVTGKQYYKVYIKQYWHFQSVPSKLNYNKNLFSENISHNNDTFAELLPNNIDLLGTYIRQHSYFHRVITK